MGLELKQNLKLSQQLVMTPQLQQAIKLLQLSRLELVDYVREELEQNPLLEDPGQLDDGPAELAPGEASLEAETEAPAAPPEPSPNEEVKGDDGENRDIDWEQYLESYQTLGAMTPGSGSSDELPSLEATLTTTSSLLDHLVWQAGFLQLSDDEQRVLALILGNIDDDGYFKIADAEGDPLIRVAAEAGVSLSAAERVLKQIQRFEPSGVGARDLRECLLIQARQQQVEDILVGEIIRDHLGLLERHNLPLIARKTGASLDEVSEAFGVITKMEPKPGRTLSSEQPRYISPDVYIQKVGDEYVTIVNDDGLTKLKVSENWRRFLREGASPGETKEFLQERMRSAVWLIKSIHMRQRTIHKVTESIIKFQHDFFEKGIAFLRPLILREVADDIGMHESTISRVTSGKYVHTPQGTYELKFFFNASIAKTGGDEIANEAVKAQLKKLIAAEDPRRPYSDQKLVELLQERGIEIARRTVAKYRDFLGILPSSRRRTYG